MADDVLLIEATQDDIAKFLHGEYKTTEEDVTSTHDQEAKCGIKLWLMSAIMAFSRLCGVTQYSYYMLDILESSGVSISPSWASAGVTIFEMIGTYVVAASLMYYP